MLRYTIRNLFARARTVLQGALSIAVTVATAIVLFSALEGVTATVLRTGDARNVDVFAAGTEEHYSQVPIPTINLLHALPGIGKEGTVDQVSPELVAQVRYKTPAGLPESLHLRGVDPVAFAQHGVTIDGRRPERGEPGVLVGARRSAYVHTFAPTGVVHVGRERWPVLGVLHAPGSLVESELWCDRTALSATTHNEFASVVSLRADTPEKAALLVDAVERIRGARLSAVTEPAHYQRRVKVLTPYLRTIQLVITLLIIGAAFACMNASYAVFLSRTRELATLIAIGYRRRRLALMLLGESLILAALGWGIGALAVPAVQGRELAYDQLELYFSCRVTPSVLLTSIAIAATIAILGGLISVVLTFRLSLLGALRE
jgi:putative ABC transport system permease protein